MLSSIGYSSWSCASIHCESQQFASRDQYLQHISACELFKDGVYRCPRHDQHESIGIPCRTKQQLKKKLSTCMKFALKICSGRRRSAFPGSSLTTSLPEVRATSTATDFGPYAMGLPMAPPAMPFVARYHHEGASLSSTKSTPVLPPYHEQGGASPSLPMTKAVPLHPLLKRSSQDTLVVPLPGEIMPARPLHELAAPLEYELEGSGINNLELDDGSAMIPIGLRLASGTVPIPGLGDLDSREHSTYGFGQWTTQTEHALDATFSSAAVMPIQAVLEPSALFSEWASPDSIPEPLSSPGGRRLGHRKTPLSITVPVSEPDWAGVPSNQQGSSVPTSRSAPLSNVMEATIASSSSSTPQSTPHSAFSLARTLRFILVRSRTRCDSC